MNWTDITLHAIAAAAIVVVAVLASPWCVAGITAANFVGRDAVQAKRKYGRWLLPWQWSRQKLLKVFVPAPAAFPAVAVVARATS